jgi:hypothetical protein
MSQAEDMSREEEENCDSIKWFASIATKKMNIQTSSLDDFIRMLNIFMTIDIEKCDSFFTSVSNNIFRTFHSLLNKFVSQQNEQMQNIERYMYKVQNIRGYLIRIAEMFTFLRQADDDRMSGKTNNEIKEDFLRRFPRDNILAKNIYNLVEWKKKQKKPTSDDMALFATIGARMGGRSKSKKNGSRGKNSHRKTNHKKNKNKSRRGLHIKKKQ